MFKNSVVDEIVWAQKSWPDPEHIGTLEDGDLYVLHMDVDRQPFGAEWCDAFVGLESANGTRMRNHIFQSRVPLGF